jgi:hypothetical protein
VLQLLRDSFKSFNDIVLLRCDQQAASSRARSCRRRRRLSSSSSSSAALPLVVSMSKCENKGRPQNERIWDTNKMKAPGSSLLSQLFWTTGSNQLQVLTRVAPTHGGDATTPKKPVMKIFSNQRPSSALVGQKTIFGIREPPVPISTFWNQRTAGSYFNLLESKNRGSGALAGQKRKTRNQRTTGPCYSKPTKSWRGLGLLQCCPAGYREMKMITSGSQVHTTMVIQKQVK